MAVRGVGLLSCGRDASCAARAATPLTAPEWGGRGAVGGRTHGVFTSAGLPPVVWGRTWLSRADMLSKVVNVCTQTSPPPYHALSTDITYSAVPFYMPPSDSDEASPDQVV